MTTGFIIGAGGGIDGGSGLEVCDIGMALYVDETKGLRRYLNGQIVDINTNTQAFLNRLKDITTLHPSLLCTEEEWQTAKTMSAFGQVGKFVFNYSGDEIVSVRIPRVVNVQGLFDLQNLGMTVGAGLPNITGTGKGTGVSDNYTGAFKSTGETTAPLGGANHSNSLNYNFDASRSSSIYGKSTTVQPEAIQYPYFIQIATGSETENNIINDIELNNPYSLFDSKYSDHELNNLSWLKSEGQWNAKAVYQTAYDKILENVNNCVKGFLGQTMYMWGSANGGYMTTSLTPVVGSVVYSYGSKKLVGYITEVDLTIPTVSIRDDVAGVSYTNVGRYTPSDESSSTYITDYDFVLNTADETFRLPLDTIDHPINSTGTLPVKGNGMSLGLFDAKGNYFGIEEIQTVLTSARDAYGVPVGSTSTGADYAKDNTALGVTTDPTKSGIVADLTSKKANLYLYYYVGETVQNANLIDAGRIGEQLATKTDMLQASSAGMPSSKYIDLTLGASNSNYTAPANGWFFIRKQAGNPGFNPYIAMTNLSAGELSTESRPGGAGTVTIQLFMPAKRGDIVNVYYDAIGTTLYFRFIYAEGSK